MNQMSSIIIVFAAIMCIHLRAMSSGADLQQKALLDVIERGYQDSLLNLTEEQIIDLNYFKHLLSQSKHVTVDDPLVKISDEVFVKRIVKFLDLKAGPYPETLKREENQDKFVNDYNKYLANPCEKLRNSFKLSMALYYSKIKDKDYVRLVKQNPRQYNLLETAGVCETLLKFTDSICIKSFQYLVKKKSKSAPRIFLDKLKHIVKKKDLVE